MKRVFERIRERAASFARQPLFSYLRDERLPPARRLDFVPHMSHFVMAFADLYNHVFPIEAPSDDFDALVNTHLSEDAGHWKWFLADLARAGMDPRLRYTDALRFAWSDDCVQTRLLSYRICQLSGGSRSIERFVLVSCIEATGRVALEAFAVAGGELEKRLERRLVYFGPHHVETESTHAVEAPTVRSRLEEQKLSDEEAAGLCALVDKTFPLFENSVAEMYRNAAGGKTITSFVQEHCSESGEG